MHYWYQEDAQALACSRGTSRGFRRRFRCGLSRFLLEQDHCSTQSGNKLFKFPLLIFEARK